MRRGRWGIERLKRAGRGVAVSFLWSIVNSGHELQMAPVDRHLSGCALTRSGTDNPTVAEYRGTSSCGIDAR